MYVTVYIKFRNMQKLQRADKERYMYTRAIKKSQERVNTESRINVTCRIVGGNRRS